MNNRENTTSRQPYTDIASRDSKTECLKQHHYDTQYACRVQPFWTCTVNVAKLVANQHCIHMFLVLRNIKSMYWQSLNVKHACWDCSVLRWILAEYVVVTQQWWQPKLLAVMTAWWWLVSQVSLLYTCTCSHGFRNGIVDNGKIDTNKQSSDWFLINFSSSSYS